LPSTVVSQTTLVPELSESLAPLTRSIVRLPSMVEPAIRSPSPLTLTFPATEVSTRSHQAPRGTVTLPCTITALSCSFWQVTLLDDGTVIWACNGRLDGESASPT
jgi:hypothetical protein